MSEPRSTPKTRTIGIREAYEEAGTLRSAHYAESWLVAIGIDDYGSAHPRLANAKSDAEEFAQLLEDKFGFQHVIKLFDAEASQDAIRELLQDKLPRRAGAEDRLVIFFAGHGTTRESESGSKRGYIIPQDARANLYSSYIDMEEVLVACNDFINAKHILIILDCCFSGIAAVSSRSMPKVSPSVISDAYLDRITQRTARQVMTASASDERAADSGSRPGHSAFTGALLSGLEGQADLNEDGIITASDLAGFVKPEVTHETASGRSGGQMPFFNYLAGSGQGDFVFILPDTPIRIKKKASSPIPPLNPRSPIWLAIFAMMTVMIVAFGWVAFRQRPAELNAIVKTITAEAHATATKDKAAIVAAANDPAPTRTAIAATQTKVAAIRETAAAPTIQAAIQATRDSQIIATREAVLTAEARETTRAATATTTHLVLTGPISMAGATTLEELTSAIMKDYITDGYIGVIQSDYVGTKSGFNDYFCVKDSTTDIALVTGEERELVYVEQCTSADRVPLGFPVAWGKVHIGESNEKYEPLYLYTTEEIIKSKPQIAAFIRYYLSNVNDVLQQFGELYTPVDEIKFEQGLQTLDEITQ